MFAEAQEILREAQARSAGSLDEPAGKALLASFGIGVPASRVVEDARGLPEAIAALRAPYVLKVVSAEVIHKSDFGARKIGSESLGNDDCAAGVRVWSDRCILS